MDHERPAPKDPGRDRPLPRNPISGTPPRVRWLSACGGAATALIFVVAALDVACTAVTWNLFTKLTGATSSRTAYEDVYDHAEPLTSTVHWIHLAAVVPAGAAFLIWLSRVRANAELICAAPHRLSYGWAVGGWFCPVVSLWFPHTVVADIWKASDPGTSPTAVSLRTRPTGKLVSAWWITLLLGTAGLRGYLLAEDQNFRSASTLSGALHRSIVAGILSSVLVVTAAACAALIIRRITAWQLAAAAGHGAA
ncbi:hypothetical protein HUW46_05064 [Amycolatopsis sp. CA-230715]|nr:hypothetical protein HUW46_05064 [Amycolatopsis sp. CA-230715]